MPKKSNRVDLTGERFDDFRGYEKERALEAQEVETANIDAEDEVVEDQVSEDDQEDLGGTEQDTLEEPAVLESDSEDVEDTTETPESVVETDSQQEEERVIPEITDETLIDIEGAQKTLADIKEDLKFVKDWEQRAVEIEERENVLNTGLQRLVNIESTGDAVLDVLTASYEGDRQQAWEHLVATSRAVLDYNDQLLEMSPVEREGLQAKYERDKYKQQLDIINQEKEVIAAQEKEQQEMREFIQNLNDGIVEAGFEPTPMMRNLTTQAWQHAKNSHRDITFAQAAKRAALERQRLKEEALKETPIEEIPDNIKEQIRKRDIERVKAARSQPKGKQQREPIEPASTRRSRRVGNFSTASFEEE